MRILLVDDEDLQLLRLNNEVKKVLSDAEILSYNSSLMDEVVLDITHYNGIKDETYMRSNAFIFYDSNKKYYFNSYQIVTTTSKEKDLGKIVNIDISLEPVEYDSADDFVVREYRKYARLDKNTKITEIDEWALNKVSAENNYDVHELRELLLNGHK